jgi:hypothetical protein
MSPKMVVEYLEYARDFERMAANETNPDLKAVFEKQATAYRTGGCPCRR